MLARKNGIEAFFNQFRLIASPRTPGVNAFLNACHNCIVGKGPR